MNGARRNTRSPNVEEHREYVKRIIEEKVKIQEDANLTKNGGEFYGQQNLRLMYAYEYTKMWIVNRTYDEMINAAIHKGPLTKARETHNPFALGIQLLFDGQYFTRQKRSKYARALNYAYLNDVPTIWLIGFIRLAGGPDLISEKLEAKITEDWLTHNNNSRFKSFISGKNSRPSKRRNKNFSEIYFEKF